MCVGIHACSPSYSGGWGIRMAWTREAELAVSQNCAIALQPAQQEHNSVSGEKKKKRERERQHLGDQTCPKQLLISTSSNLFLPHLPSLRTHTPNYSSWKLKKASIPLSPSLLYIIRIFNWDSFFLCHLSWSTLAQSRLTAASTSWAQVILPPQLPK